MRVKDSVVLTSWFIYDDLVYYSHDDVYWDDLYTVWGKNRFPSGYAKPQLSPEEDRNVIVKIGGTNGQNIRLNPAQFEKVMQLMNSLQNMRSSDDEEALERKRVETSELMSLLGLKEKKEEVETVEEGYSGWKMHLDGMTMTLRRKDGVEYLIETDELQLREELMFRSDISIHRVSDQFFVYTETGKDVGRPELVDLAHEVRVDDTEQVTVIMVSKKGDAATRFQCVAEITVGDVRLLLPCVYLRPIEPKKELRVMEVVLSAEEAFVSPEAVQFVSSFRYDASREGDVVVIDARRRLKQYVTYAKATGREGEICLTS